MRLRTQATAGARLVSLSIKRRIASISDAKSACCRHCCHANFMYKARVPTGIEGSLIPSRHWLRKVMSNGSCGVYTRSKSVSKRRRKVVSWVVRARDFKDHMQSLYCLKTLSWKCVIIHAALSATRLLSACNNDTNTGRSSSAVWLWSSA